MDYRTKLAELGIKLKSFRPGVDHKTVCPFCDTRPGAKTGPSLSVHIDTDDRGCTWQCHYPPCGESGGWRDKDALPRPRHRIRPKPKPARTNLPKHPPDPMMAWFKSRGISEKVAKFAGAFMTTVGFPGPNGWESLPAIALPYVLDGQVVNHKYRSESKRFVQDPGARRTLFGIDLARRRDEDVLIWVEGEMDVLAFWEAGIFNVVSLPDGAAKSEDEDGARFDAVRDEAYEDWLFSRKEYVLAVDNDGSGKTLLANLRKRFGVERCSLVDWPVMVGDVVPKDANDLLMLGGPNELRELYENRRPHPMDGMLRASDGAEMVATWMRGEGEKPVSTGFDNLTGLWHIEPESFNVITGIPNHGKSTIALQIVLQTIKLHGWRWAIMSPEHSHAGLVAKMVELHAGRPIYDGPTQPLTVGEMKMACEWMDDWIEFISVDAVPDDEVTDLDWVLSRARWAARRRGINGLLIDPWNEIEDTRPRHMTETEYIGRGIRRLKRFGKSHGVSVNIVAHPAKMQKHEGKYPVPTLYDISGSAHWNNKVDAGISIYRNFEDETTEVHVQKIRNQPRAGQQGVAYLKFNPTRRQFVDLGEDEIPSTNLPYADDSWED